MGYRLQNILQTLIGYQKTGVDLIAWNGKDFTPSGFSDDIGIYYFIPKIMQIFNIPANQAEIVIRDFYWYILISCFILCIIGLFLIIKSWIGRIIAIGVLFYVFKLSWQINDLYIITSAIIVALIPFSIYFLKNQKNNKALIIFLIIAGLMIGFSHYIRNHSGTPVILFIVFIILTEKKWVFRQKLMLFSMLFIGVLIPVIFFSNLIYQRDKYLKNQYSDYKPVLSRHVFWHNAYIGLGYLNNPFGIRWDDDYAAWKVKSVDPNAKYLSPEYDNVLKQEIKNIYILDRLFIFQTIFAKIGVCFYYFLRWANIGLLFAYFYRKSKFLDIAFFIGIAFSSLCGIMAIPKPMYLLGLIAFSAIYGVYGFGYALDKGLLNNIYQFVKNKK